MSLNYLFSFNRSFALELRLQVQQLNDLGGLLLQKMMQQVQPNSKDILRMLVQDSTTVDTLKVLKAFLLGFMRIPTAECTRILETIDNYQEWLNMMSVDNIVNIFYNSAIKIEGSLNKETNCEEGYCPQEIFCDFFQAYVHQVLQNERYFDERNVEYNPKEEIRMSLNFTENECAICTNNMDPESVMILDCTHVFHYQCLYSHVKNSIQNGDLTVKCPSQYCRIEMSSNQMDIFMEGELHRKYEDYMMNQYVERNGANTSWCPTPGCQALFEADAGVTQYDCKNCGQRYCLKCRCEFHEGMTCGQYQDYKGLNPQDRSFVDFAKGARFKQCPRCRFWVERNQGCSTMKCRCELQFCYDCGGVTCPHGKCSQTTPNAPPRHLQRN